VRNLQWTGVHEVKTAASVDLPAGSYYVYANVAHYTGTQAQGDWSGVECALGNPGSDYFSAGSEAVVDYSEASVTDAFDRRDQPLFLAGMINLDSPDTVSLDCNPDGYPDATNAVELFDIDIGAIKLGASQQQWS
jgi:hypothetical protein